MQRLRRHSVAFTLAIGAVKEDEKNKFGGLRIQKYVI